MDWTPEKPPTAKEIAARFRSAMADGAYPPGRQLPGAKGLAKQLGVALMTVQSAYKQLAEDGLVEGRRGSGTYVIDPRKGEPTAQQAVSSIRDLQEQLKQATSQIAELSERVAKLEEERTSSASRGDQ
ncbi:GntR family transcriptional regulator [Streptomyces abikoensis]|uniref:GntR family transcriptional regulator n=1 Tax=Streptomyces abikoensis TaxID=97398 RepID=UPI0033DA84B5